VDECFVGRAPELAVLEGSLHGAAAGRSQVAVVSGQAWIGKTALIKRFLAGRQVKVHWASGDQDEATLPGGLLDQLGFSGEGTVSDPLVAGSGLLAAVRAWASPAVLVVDDAQWGDDLSLRALSFALRRLQDEPVLAIIAVRAEGYASLPPGLMRVLDDRGTRLEISGFDADGIRALADRIGVGPLAARAAQRLRDHTCGVPLHVREVLCALPRESVCEVLAAPDTVLPTPKSLEARVVSWLAECSSQARLLAAAAAVLGTRCRLADAAALACLPDPLPALQEAAAHGLLTETATIDGRCCEFPHAGIRAAVYGDIGVSQRAALHRGAAVLTTGSAAFAHQVAGCPGADGDLARDLAGRARDEVAAGRPAEAAGHFLSAVRVGERGAERDRNLRAAVGLLIDVGEAARACGFAAQLAGQPASAARSALLGRLAVLRGDDRAAERLLTDAWAASPGAPAATGACELALLLLVRRRTADAARWARRAMAHATGLQRACAHVVLASSMALGGQAAEALALLRAESATAAADDPGQPLLEAGLGTISLWCDDLAAATRHLRAAARGALPLPHLLDVSVQHVLADYRTGAWDAAAARAEQLVAVAEDLDQRWLLASAHSAAVYPAAARGQWGVAQAHAGAAAGQLAIGDSTRVLDVVNARAALADARDDPDGVLAAAAPLAGRLGELAGGEPAMLGFWPLYAHALARTGRLAEAAAVLAPYADLARARRRRSAMAAAARVRAFIEAAERRPDTARQAYETAMTCLDGLGMPHEEALTRLDYGRFLRHQGQRRAALRELCAARAVFADLGAVPFADRCDAELGQYAVAEPGGAAVPARAVAPLTARQLAVAKAVAAGKSNEQVARDLYITVKTVEYHVSQIFTRLGIDARAEIAAALSVSHA
jgi:DNA-binding CsgD family transcriptional regulator